MSEPQVFSLKQVVSSIQKTFEDRYKQAYWIKAELHKLNHYPSGNCFPELVQKEEDKIVAQLNGTIWKTTFDKINKQFAEVVKEPLKEGTTVLLLGRIQYNPIYGVSLLILDIDPNFTLGALQKEKDETLKTLKKEGILNQNQSLDFPILPKRIAIISAESSKGLSDFRKVLEQNGRGYFFVTKLYQAYLQGDAAVESIRSQLKKIRDHQELFDCVVIVRGGGGEAGMTCYNNLTLCRDIANFPLPILTGIGHSTNMTVAEMIAFRNGITPTELAEMLVRCFRDFEDPLRSLQDGIKRAAVDILEDAQEAWRKKRDLLKVYASSFLQKHSLENKILRQILKEQAALQVERNKKGLLQVQSNLRENGRDFVANERLRWKQLDKDFSLGLTLRIQNEHRRLDQHSLDLKRSSKISLDEKLKGLMQAERHVKSLSPDQVLKRGFSITTLNGKLINSENQVKEGSKILTLTADHAVESTVTKIDKKDGE